MGILRFIQRFFYCSRNVSNGKVQGQNLSDIPLQQNLSDSPSNDDALLSNGVSTEQQATYLPEDVPDEQGTDELGSIVSELGHELEIGTCNKAEIHDNVQDKGYASQSFGNCLLDDAAYMALAEKCCDIISELDAIQTDDTADMSDLVKTRIKEALLCSGAESISDEISFDILRHKAEGKSIVRKGDPIAATIEPGIAIGDKVMIKAKVKICKRQI